VAERLGSGADAIDYGGVTGPDWYAGAAERIVAGMAPGDAVVVAHSGAGGLVPCLAERLGQRLSRVILVDAVMPYPGRTWFDTASGALAARVRSLATDGVLPPWDTWFGADAIARLLPEPAAAAAFRADLPRVPLAYFEARAPSLAAWERAPGAYLQLSEACAADADAAALRGWTVRREALHHLAMLTHPDRVADTIATLARA